MADNIGIMLKVEKESVRELADAIKMILTQRVDQSTMVAALETLQRGTKIEHCSISNNYIGGKDGK